MHTRWRFLLVLLAVLVPAGGVAAKAPGHGHNATERVFTLAPDPAGNNPEGIAYDKQSKQFYVSITGDGAIYRGSLDSDTIVPFIDGAAGKSAVGLEIRHGKLYVAGGTTGTITVYDLATKQVLATFETGTGGFLNDLVVTGRGDIFVTDSFRPTLWHVTAEQVEAGTGTPQALDVSAIPYETGPGQFNVNGIVNKGDKRLVVVDTNSGKLFRIKLADDRASIRSLNEITGATVPVGDGMILDKGRLVVVQGNPAQLTFLKLRSSARKAAFLRTQTSANLHGSSTVARVRGLYLVVNADFALSESPPFTVAGLLRHVHH